MGCRSCGKNKGSNIEKDRDIMEGYKYLTDRQLKSRLEVYKRKFCSDCTYRYQCDYPMHVRCKNGSK